MRGRGPSCDLEEVLQFSLVRIGLSKHEGGIRSKSTRTFSWLGELQGHSWLLRGIAHRRRRQGVHGWSWCSKGCETTEVVIVRWFVRLPRLVRASRVQQASSPSPPSRLLGRLVGNTFDRRPSSSSLASRSFRPPAAAPPPFASFLGLPTREQGGSSSPARIRLARARPSPWSSRSSAARPSIRRLPVSRWVRQVRSSRRALEGRLPARPLPRPVRSEDRRTAGNNPVTSKRNS